MVRRSSNAGDEPVPPSRNGVSRRSTDKRRFLSFVYDGHFDDQQLIEVGDSSSSCIQSIGMITK